MLLCQFIYIRQKQAQKCITSFFETEMQVLFIPSCATSLLAFNVIFDCLQHHFIYETELFRLQLSEYV